MKTHCGSCNKSSVNFLHKETGTAYCSNCGAAMKLSIEIVNALSSKKMFLPDDFFAIPAGPTRSIQQIATTQPQPRAPLQPVQIKQTAEQAALARRQYYTDKTKPDSDSGVKTINIPKVSREEAALRKAQALANIEQIAQEASVQQASVEWFNNRPSLQRDINQTAGMSIDEMHNILVDSE